MSTSSPAAPIELGVVSYLNTLPLIDGLDVLADVNLRQSVPSLLLDELVAGRVDLALCSSIDYQRSPDPLVIVPVGMLGCDGPTLTVRLFSSVPIDRISTVHCDTDSHTSVALMRILLDEVHGLAPELIDYDAREHVAANRPVHWPETMLLIGDKVVTDATPAVRYPYQLDLGAEWTTRYGLPFVFATWMARRDADPERVRTAAAILDHQRRHNIERLDGIIAREAEPRSWPRDLASTYLKERLCFDFDERAADALDRFFDRADECGLIPERRPTVYVGH
jgi:chorismate dehydratase